MAVILIVLLIVACFGLGIVARPTIVFAFSVAVFAFEQWAQSNSGFFGSHGTLINLALGILTLWAVICVILRGQNPLNPLPPAMVVFFALYAYCFASCFWSIDRELSLFLFKHYAPYVLTVSIMIPMVFQKDRDLADAMIATMVFGTIVMILILTGTQLHAHGRTIEADIVNKFGQAESRLSPLAVADMGGQMLIVAMLVNFHGKRRIWQSLRWVIALLAVALIVRSGSRGQFIAAFLSILVCITFSRGTKNVIGYIAGGVSIALVLALAAFGYAAATEGQAGSRWDIESMQTSFASTRIIYVTKLLTYWAESSPISWFFGLGSSASFDPRIIGTYCHIVLAEVLGELGFVGLATLVLFFGLVARDGIRLYFLSKPSPEDRGAAVALIGLFLFQFMLAFKQGSFLSQPATWCVALIISRQAAVKQGAVQGDSIRAKRKQWLAIQRWNWQQGQSHPQGTQPAS